MARSLRIEFAGATYHVTSRGNEQRNIFYGDADRQAFLALLGDAARRFGWSVSAWVLMTNHFHIVLHTPQPNLSKGMQWLNGTYAAWFNRRHNRSGHLFQGRFKAFLIEKESYYSEVLRYVVLNPVRAGLVDHPAAYRWSSYRGTSGLEAHNAWMDVAAALEPFGGADEMARLAYRQFVLEKIGCHEPLWQRLVHGIYLGGDAWAKQMRAQLESKPRSSDHPKAHRAIGRPKMHQIIAAVATAAATTPDVIRAMRGNPLRALTAWIGWHEGWHTLRSIAASLRLRSEGHISNMIRRCERMLARNATLVRHLDAALALTR
ncbi:MAG TPA: transposase [Thermoanaerobaculia bacterium]|jgi:REP element-mobilizing transposase RayT